MIRNSQIVVSYEGQAYTIFATGDIDSFWARRSGSNEDVSDPQTLTALYSAGRGAILSKSLLSPDRGDLLSHTVGVRNFYDELRDVQGWKIGSDALAAFTETTTAVFSLMNPRNLNPLNAVSAAKDVAAALVDVRSDVASEAFVLALMDSALVTAEDITTSLRQVADEIFDRLERADAATPVTTEELQLLTEESLGLYTRHTIISELGEVVLSSIDDPWWQSAADIFSPIANFVVNSFGDGIVDAQVLEVSNGLGEIEGLGSVVQTAVEGYITQRSALEIFESIAERIAVSSPEFYSSDAEAEYLDFFTAQFTPPEADPDTLPDNSPSGGDALPPAPTPEPEPEPED